MSEITVPATVNTNWPKLHDAIHQAGQTGDLSDLQAALKTESIDAKANAHNWCDASVLHTAATTNDEIFNLLLENGAQGLLDSQCTSGEEGRWSGHTPLQVAAKCGCYAIALRLIEAGATYDAFSAAALGDIERLDQLVANDNQLMHTTDDYNATLLHWAARQDQHEVTEFLLDQQLEVDAMDDFGETPLLVASVREVIQSDIKNHAKRRSLSVTIPTPPVTELLLDRGAAVDLFSAAALGYADTLTQLLNNDTELANSANQHDTTPLHWAARNAQVDTAHLLLNAGADINASDKIGCPPLWYAAYWGNDAGMTQFLCDRGADVTFQNVWGKGIRDYDIGWGCCSVVLRYQSSC